MTALPPDPLVRVQYRIVPHADLVLRVMGKVSIDEATGCWLWNGSKSSTGYGQIWVPGKTRQESRLAQAHRFTFEMFRGEIPRGYQIDHLCRCRNCVNPNHLEPVTQQENIRRGEGGQQWAAKTHCPNGHPYDRENTYKYKGSRFCRECQRIAARRLYWARKKGA